MHLGWGQQYPFSRNRGVFPFLVKYFSYFSQYTVLILRNAPALINVPCLFSKIKCYINLHEFLFASLDDVALFDMGSTRKGRICSYRSKFFPLRVDPTEQEGKTSRAASLVVVVVLLFYFHGKQLRSCRDSQLT